MSQRPRPRFFLAKLDLDRNIPNFVFDDPNDHFPGVKTVRKYHIDQRVTQLVWELDGGILGFDKLEDLTETVEKGNHREVESPVVEDSPEV